MLLGGEDALERESGNIALSIFNSDGSLHGIWPQAMRQGGGRKVQTAIFSGQVSETGNDHLINGLGLDRYLCGFLSIRSWLQTRFNGETSARTCRTIQRQSFRSQMF